VNELFDLAKQFALNNVITSIFLSSEISCQLMLVTTGYSNVARYSAAKERKVERKTKKNGKKLAFRFLFLYLCIS